MARKVITKINSLLNEQKQNQHERELFSSFAFSHVPLSPVTRLVLKRYKKYKKELRLGFGGLGGVRFKFIIPHVQVNIKMLRVIQHSCQRGVCKDRPSPVPAVVCLIKKKRKKKSGAWILAGPLAYR